MVVAAGALVVVSGGVVVVDGGAVVVVDGGAVVVVDGGGFVVVVDEVGGFDGTVVVAAAEAWTSWGPAVGSSWGASRPRAPFRWSRRSA